jgi:hypothetical protein
VPDDLPRARKVDGDGPAAVLTLGRVRLGRVVSFFRTSAKAEGAVLEAPGLIWATGLAKPPFVATCSLWQSSDALSAYAYGSDAPAHPSAIAADRAKPFHQQSAFIRFRPYDSEGKLDGRNPLAESWTATGQAADRRAASTASDPLAAPYVPAPGGAARDAWFGARVRSLGASTG